MSKGGAKVERGRAREGTTSVGVLKEKQRKEGEAGPAGERKKTGRERERECGWWWRGGEVCGAVANSPSPSLQLAIQTRPSALSSRGRFPHSIRSACRLRSGRAQQPSGAGARRGGERAGRLRREGGARRNPLLAPLRPQRPRGNAAPTRARRRRGRGPAPKSLLRRPCLIATASQLGRRAQGTGAACRSWPRRQAPSKRGARRRH
jgi:hypothetical protein